MSIRVDEYPLPAGVIDALNRLSCACSQEGLRLDKIVIKRAWPRGHHFTVQTAGGAVSVEKEI